MFPPGKNNAAQRRQRGSKIALSAGLNNKHLLLYLMLFWTGRVVNVRDDTVVSGKSEFDGARYSLLSG